MERRSGVHCKVFQNILDKFCIVHVPIAKAYQVPTALIIAKSNRVCALWMW